MQTPQINLSLPLAFCNYKRCFSDDMCLANVFYVFLHLLTTHSSGSSHLLGKHRAAVHSVIVIWSNFERGVDMCGSTSTESNIYASFFLFLMRVYTLFWLTLYFPRNPM